MIRLLPAIERVIVAPRTTQAESEQSAAVDFDAIARVGVAVDDLTTAQQALHDLR